MSDNGKRIIEGLEEGVRVARCEHPNNLAMLREGGGWSIWCLDCQSWTHMAPSTTRAGDTHDGRIRAAYNRGVRKCVAWLHARSEEMEDRHARALLNSAAFDLGRDKAMRAKPTGPKRPATRLGRRAP